MSTIATLSAPMRAWHDGGNIRVELEDGRRLCFPKSITPRLAKATAQQLNHIDLSPYGLHWPDVDEDLSISSLVRDGFTV